MTKGRDRPIFFDYAGSSPVSDAVFTRQVAHLRREQEIGGYAAAEEVANDMTTVRRTLAELVGGSAERIALGESSTVLWARALSMIPFEADSRVIVTAYEYGSNIIALASLAERIGLQVDIVPALPSGQVNLDEFGSAIERPPSPSLVALCHIPTSRGICLDVRSMAERALDAGAFVFVDACQSVGQVPTDWLDCAADVVVCSGRKFVGGPRGTAFVSLSQRFLDQATPREADICGARINLDLRLKVEFPIGLMERWEGNIAGYLGLGIAADETLAASGDREVRRRSRLTESIRDALRSIRGVEICDPPDVDYASTLTFVVRGVEATELVARCRRAGVLISEVETYTAPLDLPGRVGRDVNRISVGRTTVESDIKDLVASLTHATKLG